MAKFSRAMEWQPIDSAPKDGSVVLFCDERGNRWTDCSPGHPANGCGYPPTHWQVLPPPPVDQQPDGKMTTSAARYVREWRRLQRPLESALGLRTIGFDPGFLMRDANAPMAPPVDIPVWLARRIVSCAKMLRNLELGE